MFGPNHSPRYHHRERNFSEHYEDTVNLFCDFAGISPNEWDVFFITGSGTCAIQTILYSVNTKLNVLTDGLFSERMRRFLDEQGKLDTTSSLDSGVCYETSISHYNSDLSDDIFMCDCVSSFPYYEPKGQMWATVTSKQLGCSPGLSVVVMKKYLWDTDLISPADESYLSLGKFKAKRDIYQTPHTPAINLIDEFHSLLSNYTVDTFREKILERRTELLRHIPVEQTIGDGPVLTLKDDEQSKALTIQFSLYNNSSEGPQVFLWSGTGDQYDKLYNAVEDIYG
jgi:aspartate aminotransferase-like enzyme